LVTPTWLLVLDDLGLDDFVVGGLVGGAGPVLGALLLGLSLGIDRAAHLLADLGRLFRGGAYRLGVGALQRLLQLRDRLVDLGGHVGRNLVGVLGEELLRGVGERLAAVADL